MNKKIFSILYKSFFTNGLIKAFLLMVFLTAPTFVKAAPGDLDSSFAGTGKSRLGFSGNLQFGGGADQATATAVQADGKLIVVGYGIDGSRNAFIVARYNADGSLDTSFGGFYGGKVTTHIGFTSDARAVQIQSDGKIVVAGVTNNGIVDSDFAVARYNSDGTLDATFDGDGIVTTNIFGTNNDEANALAVQSDGKIVVVGFTASTSSPVNRDVALVRYNANGSLDTTFDTDGIAITALGTSNELAKAVTLQTDGKIVVSGYADLRTSGSSFIHDFAVLRYNSNGSLDNSFDTDGIVTTQFGTNNSESNAITIQISDDLQTQPEKIVAVGYSRNGTLNSFTVVRYNLDGSLDTSFDGDGIVQTVISTGNTSTATSVVIQRESSTVRKIVVGGYIGTNGFALARYNSSGTPDTTFDSDGKLTAFPTGSGDLLNGIAIQNNKIVAVGIANRDFGIMRFNLTGSVDNTFDTDGRRLDDFGNPTAIAKGVVIQPDGKIVVAGYTFNENNNNKFGLIRYNANGSLDTTFDGDGKVVTGYTSISNDSGNAVALQTDGKIVVAGVNLNGSFGDFAVVRFNADGSLDSGFDPLDFDGKVTTNVSHPDTFTAVAIQSDGKIVAAGFTDNNTGGTDFTVVRYFSDGSLDNSFNGTGIARTPFPVGSRLNGMVLQPNGKIVVAGYSRDANGLGDFAVVRYNSNGTLDTAGFQGTGIVTTDFGGVDDKASAVALQPDGKIVVAGYSTNGTNYDFTLARYNADGSLDNSFDGDGKLKTPVGSLGDNAYTLAIQTDGKILAAGSFDTGTSSVSNLAVVRYNADGSLDTSYGAGGKVIVDVINGLYSVANAITFDSTGNAVIAGAAGGLFGVVRLLGDNNPTFSISGTISYGTGTTQKFVLGVMMNLSGASSASTTTNSAGTYVFNNLPAGVTITITPSKTGNVNGITAFDATLVLRCVAAGNACALTTNQRAAADTDNSSNVTAFDATQILRFVAANGANANTGQVGDWKFLPPSRSYQPLNNAALGENYEAILLGEVSGDWAAGN